jgi:hypothetical protein
MRAGAAVSVTRNIFVRGVPAGLKMWLLSSRGGFGDWAKFPNELLCIIELFFWHDQRYSCRYQANVVKFPALGQNHIRSAFEITCDAKTYMSNKNPFVAVYLFKPSTESYLFIPEVKGR